ncbi:MAG: septation protein SpoVG family protein [Elusimicrobia bacterium]|nr:septation protein SpoVG family protein [Elusimicrobiota bacterium]
MEITEIRVHLRSEDKLKAFVTVTFDSCFVVRNMKIIQGTKGLLLCMPSRKLTDGTYKDIAHPITVEFRKLLEDRVMGIYEAELKKGGTAPPAGGSAASGTDS